MTGVSGDGTQSPVALEELKEEAAKVNPPETIFQASERHLSRHGLMIWDAPDGKVVVGYPEDKQRPLYTFRMFGDSRRNQNNVLRMHRTKDWSGVPGLLYVAGTGGNKDWTKAKVRGFVDQTEVAKAGFYRPVLIVNEGLKNDAMAQRQADREMTNRIKRMDTWTVTVDGLSYWDGSERIQYAIDTTAEVFSTVAGGPNGAYLVTRVQLNRNVSEGDTAELTLLKRGLWRL
jgi:prophage tail gpP-like protein